MSREQLAAVTHTEGGGAVNTAGLQINGIDY